VRLSFFLPVLPPRACAFRLRDGHGRSPPSACSRSSPGRRPGGSALLFRPPVPARDRGRRLLTYVHYKLRLLGAQGDTRDLYIRFQEKVRLTRAADARERGNRRNRWKRPVRWALSTIAAPRSQVYRALSTPAPCRAGCTRQAGHAPQGAPPDRVAGHRRPRRQVVPSSEDRRPSCPGLERDGCGRSRPSISRRSSWADLVRFRPRFPPIRLAVRFEMIALRVGQDAREPPFLGKKAARANCSSEGVGPFGQPGSARTSLDSLVGAGALARARRSSIPRPGAYDSRSPKGRVRDDPPSSPASTSGSSGRRRARSLSGSPSGRRGDDASDVTQRTFGLRKRIATACARHGCASRGSGPSLETPATGRREELRFRADLPHAAPAPAPGRRWPSQNFIGWFCDRAEFTLQPHHP
jgi:hypothetical protein